MLSILIYSGCEESDQSKREAPLLVDQGNYYILGGDMLLDKSDPKHQLLIAKLLSTDEGSDSTEELNVSTLSVYSASFH
jgi:hypothetical protein